MVRTRVLRDRDIALLCAGTTISGLGSGLLVVAVPAQVYLLTGSTLATALALAVEAAPAILVGPWAGVLADRWSLRATMVVADLAAAAGVLPLLLATSPDRLAAVYIGLLAENVAVAFQRPAARALLPALTGTGDRLAGANSVLAFTGGVVRLAGPPLGTLLLSTGGMALTVGVDAATYLASAVLTAAVRAPARPDVTHTSARTGLHHAESHPPAQRGEGTTGRRGLGRELRDGWRTLMRIPVLRRLLAATWAFWTLNAALTALLVPFVVNRLRVPGADVGYLVSGLGVGYLAGSAFAGRLVRRWPPGTVLAASYAACGCCFLLMFHAPTLPAAVAATAAVGVPGAVALVATQYRLQATTPPEVRARVGAAFYASDAVAAIAGALLAPVVTATTGLSPALDVFSAAVIAVGAALAVAPARQPRLVRHDPF